MDELRDPLVVFCLLLMFGAGWLANEAWDRIIYSLRVATDEATGWLHDIVYVLGWATVIVGGVGAVGWGFGWW